MSEQRTPVETVAANVRRLRQQREWSQAALAKRLTELGHRYSLPVLSKIEIGDRGIDVNDLVALSDALGVPATELLREPRAPEETLRPLLEALESMERRRLEQMADVAESEQRIRMRVRALWDQGPATQAALLALVPDDFVLLQRYVSDIEEAPPARQPVRARKLPAKEGAGRGKRR